MILGSVIKQPNETFPIAVDFTAAIVGAGETISTATCTAREKDSGTAYASLLSGSTSISGLVVSQQLAAAGVDGTKYIVQFHVTTSAANQYEDEVIVAVKEY